LLTRSRHWSTNEVVSVDKHHGAVDVRHRTARYYRPDLQKSLLAHVPAERIHLQKAFSTVDFNDASGNLVISFVDGSTANADILLGADGIKSAVRRQFVANSDPQWTGWVAFRSVFDVKALDGLDTGVDEANHWWGPDRTFFASRLGSDLFTIVGGNYSDPDAPDAAYKDTNWNSDGSIDVLREYYKDWHPAVRKLVEATPYIRQYPNTAAPGLTTWIYGNGRVTLVGDAAHAHGGALAAGGSLALDDAYAIKAALWHVFRPGAIHTTADIQRALSLYQRTRKTHTDRVVSMIQQGNKATIARIQKGVETDQELRMRLGNRSDPYWIHEHNVEAEFAQAAAEDLTTLD
jgi:salicylate hydroxylase